jgi:hypothetical protein
MKTRGAIRSLVAGAALALAVAAGAQERVKIPNTSVTLTAPPGFAPARGVAGLENAATNSTITISERPGEAYAEVAEIFSSARTLSQRYASQNVTIRSVRELIIGNARVPFASGRQLRQGEEFVKYYALLKGDKTVLVAFTIADRSFSEADAEAVVRSVELTPEPTVEERLATLPFSFRVVEPFNVTEVRARSLATLIAGDGSDATRSQPVVVVERALARAAAGDEPRIADELVRTVGGFREAALVEQRAAPFAGGDGYFVTAVAEGRTLVQYLRVLPGGAYVRLVARGDTGAMESLAEAITAMAESVAIE